MTLYDYQDAFVAAVGDAFAQGATSVCGVLPTGAGKTRATVAMCLRHLAQEPRRSVVWLAPLTELVRQAKDAFPADVSVVTATGATEAQETIFARVHVSTVHALARTGLRPRGTFVVLDEAQYFFGTPAWNAVAQSYRAQGARVLSLTATPTRLDGTALSTLADAIVVGPSVQDLIDRWRRTDGREGLVPPRVFAPAGRLDRGGDPVAAYLAHAPGTKAIAFCVDRAAARALCAAFLAAGVSAAWADADHREGLAQHRAGRVQVLCNVFLVSVGYDDPTVETVIWARGCGNAATYIQGNGRALRPARGKGAAYVLDLLGNVHQHGLPEERRTYSLEGRAIRLAGSKPLPLATCGACGALYRPGGTACACSPVVRAADPPTPKAPTAKQLARRALQEVRATEPEANKRAFYDGLRMRAVAEGWTRWVARARFKAHYGYPPPRAWGG